MNTELKKQLPMKEYEVYKYLKECDENGKYPTINDISIKIGRCRGDVAYIIKQLENKEVISHLKSRPNVYTILK